MQANLARIRQLRKAQGLTLQDVGKRLGYASVAGYCRIETGRRKIRLEQIEPLAEILGVKVSEILDTGTTRTARESAL